MELDGRALWGPGMPTPGEVAAAPAESPEPDPSKLTALREELAELERQITRGLEGHAPKDPRRDRRRLWDCPVQDRKVMLPAQVRRSRSRTGTSKATPVVQAPHTDASGWENPAIRVVRRFVRGEGGGWEPRWPPGYKATEGSPFPPFGLSFLHQRAGRPLLICEGESDMLLAGSLESRLCQTSGLFPESPGCVLEPGRAAHVRVGVTCPSWGWSALGVGCGWGDVVAGRWQALGRIIGRLGEAQGGFGVGAVGGLGFGGGWGGRPVVLPLA